MIKPMRDKVLAVIATYAEGTSTITAVLKQHRVHFADFYGYLAKNPDVEAEYHAAQKARADMSVADIVAIADEDPDSRRARVRIEARVKQAQMYDRARFGEQVKIEHSGQVDITAALTDARRRALPACDLEHEPSAQVIDITPVRIPNATDAQSADQANAAPKRPSIFDD